MALDPEVVDEAYFEHLPAYLADWERRALRAFPERFVEGTVDVTDVIQVYVWKNHGSGFSERNLFRFLDADLAEIQSVLDEALGTGTAEERVAVLTDLAYVSVPTASAILVFSAPDTYSVYDRAVVRALADRFPRRAGDLPASSPSPADYAALQSAVDDVRPEGVSVRVFDRALWLHGSGDADYELPEDVREAGPDADADGGSGADAGDDGTASDGNGRADGSDDGDG